MKVCSLHTYAPVRAWVCADLCANTWESPREQHRKHRLQGTFHRYPAGNLLRKVKADCPFWTLNSSPACDRENKHSSQFSEPKAVEQHCLQGRLGLHTSIFRPMSEDILQGEKKSPKAKGSSPRAHRRQSEVEGAANPGGGGKHVFSLSLPLTTVSTATMKTGRARGSHTSGDLVPSRDSCCRKFKILRLG